MAKKQKQNTAAPTTGETAESKGTVSTMALDTEQKSPTPADVDVPEVVETPETESVEETKSEEGDVSLTGGDAGAPETKEEPEPDSEQESGASSADGLFDNPITGVEMVIRDRMLAYANAMRPGTGGSNAERARQQVLLLSTIESAISTPSATDFVSAMAQIRHVVAANLGDVFDDRYLFRELGNMSIPATRLKHAEYMFVMIQAISADDYRDRLARIGAPDFVALLAGVRDDEVRSRLQQWLARISG